jgi:hypothetical protein
VQIDVIDNIASGFDIVDDSALVAATVRLGRLRFEASRNEPAPVGFLSVFKGKKGMVRIA